MKFYQIYLSNYSDPYHGFDIHYGYVENKKDAEKLCKELNKKVKNKDCEFDYTILEKFDIGEAASYMR
jgi:hypothetical protein